MRCDVIELKRNLTTQTETNYYPIVKGAATEKNTNFLLMTWRHGKSKIGVSRLECKKSLKDKVNKKA